jgi:hypothetical protein
MSVITVVGHNLLQMNGSLLIEVMHQTFPCTRGVVWLCELSVQSAGLQRIRVFHDQHTLFEDDLLAHDRIHLGSINPSIGSVFGGLHITIHGSGFSRSSSIVCSFGHDNHSFALTAEDAFVICISPPSSGHKVVEVRIRTRCHCASG